MTVPLPGRMSRHARRMAGVVISTLVASAGPALAHEPLWGETPTVFGPHVFHPEIRLGYLRRGDTSDPGEARTDELAQEYALQYGINRFVNLKVILPVMRMEMDENVNGAIESVLVSGVGDAILAAKYRFDVRQETGHQTSQALVAGWKIPTGDDDRAGPDGERLAPSDQPGSGQQGIRLGWAVDQERLVDSTWLSVFYNHDFGGGFRRGDTFELDAAYGRWVLRPNVADDLGLNLAFGLHAASAANDHLEADASADNANRYAGVQVTQIISKGRAQYRVGVFVPLLRGGDEERTDFSYEVRAGWEMFF